MIFTKSLAHILDGTDRKTFQRWGARTESRATVTNSIFMAQSEPGVAIKLNKFDSVDTDPFQH